MPVSHNALPESARENSSRTEDANAELRAGVTQVSEAFAAFELYLNTLRLGTEVWVPISNEIVPSPELDEAAQGAELGFCRHRGKWSVCLRRPAVVSGVVDPNTRETFAFLDAPRLLKLVAVDHMATLHASVRKLLESYAEIAVMQARKAEFYISELLPVETLESQNRPAIREFSTPKVAPKVA